MITNVTDGIIKSGDVQQNQGRREQESRGSRDYADSQFSAGTPAAIGDELFFWEELRPVERLAHEH